jgi:hypothetical protein
MRQLDDSPWAQGEAAVSRDEWLAASVIAGLRVESNRDRASHRSRGASKDILNDIQGVIGEIVALGMLEREHGADAVGHELLHWGGGTEDEVQRVVDFLVRTPSGVDLRLESKCHLDAPNKMMFLINARAHDRSARRGAAGYMPLIGAVGRSRMRVGRPVRHAEIDPWELHDYGYGDLALRRKLTLVGPDFFDLEWSRQLKPRVLAGQPLASDGTLRMIAKGAIRRFEQLRDSGFSVTGLPHARLVARARVEAAGCWEAGTEASI